MTYTIDVPGQTTTATLAVEVDTRDYDGSPNCQSASNVDPLSACKNDPSGAELARCCVVSI